MGVAERRDRERARRRDDIVSAAEAVFAERGYGPATMEDVAARAEVGKGTLYLYFESKDALFGAIAARSLAGVQRDLTDALRPEVAPADALRIILTTHLAHLRSQPWKVRVVLGSFEPGASLDVESPALEGYRTAIRGMVGLVASVIARGQADGTFRGDLDPDAAWVHLWSASLGLLVMLANRSEVERRSGIRIDPDRAVANHVALQLRSLAPDPTAPPPDQDLAAAEGTDR